MQKLRKYLGKYLPPAKIYREDIEEICRYFTEISDKITIEADGFLFENLDELFSYQKNELNNLHLCIYNPYVNIIFKPNEIWLYANDDTSVQLGLFEKIKSVVKRQKNWAFWLTTNYFSFAIVGVVTGIGIAIILFSPDVNVTSNLIKGSLIIVSCLLWGFYVSKIRFRKYSQIILSYKKSCAVSFFERNRDNIAITIVVTVLGIIVSHQWK